MPIHLGAPMDENPPDAEPIVIFTTTYEAAPEPTAAAGSVM
jgi:hypothetical protein